MFFTQEQQEIYNKFKRGETKFNFDRNEYPGIIDGILKSDDESSFSTYFMCEDVLYEINTDDYTKENFYISSFHDEIKINQIIFIAIIIYEADFNEFNIKEKLAGKIINKETICKCYFSSHGIDFY